MSISFVCFRPLAASARQEQNRSFRRILKPLGQFPGTKRASTMFQPQADLV
jgi:hypothetical protein